MDHTQAKLFSEMELNFVDPVLMHDWRMKSTHFFDDFSTENGIAKPAIQLTKSNVDWSSCTSARKTIHRAYSSVSTNMISFEESNSTPRTKHHNQLNGKPNSNIKTEVPAEIMPLENTINFSSPLIVESSTEELYGGMGYCEPSKRSGSSGKRTVLQAEEHVLAERKRRKKLTRQFIDLSGMIPGLQKVDKSSILGGAIKYIKELEEEKKRIYEESSAVSSKRCGLPPSDDRSSSIENFDSIQESSPKVDVKISGESVVFVIDCKDLKGIIDEISGAAKHLHLRVISSCSMELGDGKILITILSKMGVRFSSTAKDLVNNITMAILNLM